MKKILYIILLISSNLFSQNITSYAFTNLVRKDLRYVEKYLASMDWKEIKTEKVNVSEYYYSNSSDGVHLNSKIKIQFNKDEEINSIQLEIENKKIFENYLVQLKSNKKLKLTKEKNNEYKFVSIDLKYEFKLYKETNNNIELCYVTANRIK